MREKERKTSLAMPLRTRRSTWIVAPVVGDEDGVVEQRLVRLLRVLRTERGRPRTLICSSICFWSLAVKYSFWLRRFFSACSSCFLRVASASDTSNGDLLSS